MKRLLATIAGLACAMAVTVHAADATAKPKPNAEAKAVKKEMLEKYDTNKDGKLDKAERAKISKEDQQKMADAGLTKQPKKKNNKAN